MNNFTFHLSTKLYFGEDQEKRIGEILDNYGFKNVLIVGGQHTLIKSGLLAIVEQSLKEKKIKYHIYRGITPNPEIRFVKEALEIAKQQEIDMILAIGGGSVIDVAKVVSVNYFYNGDPLDFNSHKAEPKKALPIGVILTHAAAGSEMSTSAVISDSASNFKQGFNSSIIRPLFAIENPRYTLTLSKEQTGIGVVDIMMHTLERYFNQSTDGLLSDSFAEALLKNVIYNAKKLLVNPNDLEARANLMLANSFSHNGITGLGKPQKMPVHQLEHAVSGLFPYVPHGAGLAILFPSWARYYQQFDPAKFDQLGRNVFNLHNEDPIQNGLNAISELEKFFVSLGLSLKLSSFGIQEKDLDKLALIATKNKQIDVYHYLIPLNYETVIQVYRNCL